ncbi:translation initiation factor IF-2 subunit beta [Sulfodiicoccus acidiphilus]|uniref:Translation initiation factor 2 subunit beta n=1 Tax=Sulfodiicoccus acidiphilus TaxID=1670455 RepID=A0A348B430_9CREN|nr:translation initiation factor IF-2 subunit beta [Sulfodiicoccus acidiphilus]BBD72932.1 translation initiation factor IF-2 subunit beta [Sulfodiicoccus acidiphilus]GGT87901.1 translation initiation factor IF-2 subunit beta [Sulfodiicoccus acidiphilus]
MDKSYQQLLDRLYAKLPQKEPSSAYQELPKLNIMSAGNLTVIRNFEEYCDRIRRDPKLVTKYLLKELAAPGMLQDNGQLSIQGKFSSTVINTLMDRFVKVYVQCPTCKSLDTVLKLDKRVWTMSCLACGAVTTIKPL